MKYEDAPEGYKFIFSKTKTVNGKKYYKPKGFYRFLVKI